jgi:hypothetical protein
MRAPHVAFERIAGETSTSANKRQLELINVLAESVTKTLPTMNNEPEYFNPNNSEEYSNAITQLAPELFNPNKYNWEKDSWAIVEYAPHLIDLYENELKKHL